MSLTSEIMGGITYDVIYTLNNWIVYYISGNNVIPEVFVVHSHPESIPHNMKLTLDWIKDRTTCYCGTKMPKNIIILKALYDTKF